MLRCYIYNPYWADKIKSAAIGWEFRHCCGPRWSVSKYQEVAALLSVSVMTALKKQTETRDFWLSGWQGKIDLDSLISVATDTFTLHFPWICVGWKTKKEAVAALKHLNDPEDEDGYIKSVIHIKNAKSIDFAPNRLVSCRLNGKVISITKEKGYSILVMEAEELPDMSIAEWEAEHLNCFGCERKVEKKKEEMENDDTESE